MTEPVTDSPSAGGPRWAVLAGALGLALLAVTAPAAPAPSAYAEPVPTVPGTSVPGSPTVAELLSRMRTLYQRAEVASEAYNGTNEKLGRARAKYAKVDRQLRQARSRLGQARSRAGEMARQQYQGRATGFPPLVRLLLTDKPEDALRQGHLMKRAAGEQAATVRQLTYGERRLDRLTTKARKSYTTQRKLAERKKRQRDAVRGKLRDVQRMLASLTPAQLSAVRSLEQQRTRRAQRSLMGTQRLSGSRAPSAQGEKALRYALAQLGKPYVWGATGPSGYDCSGLTSRAWASAGRPLPRTSQEQWRRLDRVPLSGLRPGDLVIYFPKATHVAIYLGQGRVVQAPRPGSRVKVSPLAANPVLGAVRPDPAARSVADYRPPRVPRGASEGSDTGNNAG
ncbi:NlpC/P60 family protein [Streptomyces sp. NPDC005438]|uniref:C40 family peptidase n=1 Tax=Streptomyces sp. NPDC005438 TaxID=3156880 RepID=UPI0033BBA534